MASGPRRPCGSRDVAMPHPVAPPATNTKASNATAHAFDLLNIMTAFLVESSATAVDERSEDDAGVRRPRRGDEGDAGGARARGREGVLGYSGRLAALAHEKAGEGGGDHRGRQAATRPRRQPVHPARRAVGPGEHG